MRASGALALVALAGCVVATPSGGPEVPAEALKPAKLTGGPAWPGEIRTVTVRAYADESHQRAMPGWQVRFYRLVERVNPVLKDAVGIRLEIDKLGDWARPRGVGGLPSALYDLVEHDSGAGVDWVVGLTEPVAGITNVHDDLALARLFGPHIVMRPVDEKMLLDSTRRRLANADADAQDAIYLAQRAHLEAVVFLHAVGHSLGALDVRLAEGLMFERATLEASAFGADNLRLMRIAAAARGPRPGRWPSCAEANCAPMLEAFRAALTKSRGALDPEGRARLLALLADDPKRALRVDRATQRDVHPYQAPTETDPASRPASEGPPPVAAAALKNDAEVARRALEMADEAPEAAWELARPVLARYPDHPGYQELGCQLGLRRAPKADATLAQCDRAVSLAPDSATARLWRGWVRLRREERPDALADARSAQALLTKTGAGVDSLWTALAQLYAGLSAVTWAEQAAQKSGDSERAADIAKWANKIRGVYGLTNDAAERGVPPEAESDYISLRGRMRAAVAREEVKTVRALRAELNAKYPKMARTSPDTCRLLVEGRRWQKAWPSCRAAARAAPRSPEAQTLVAVAAFGLGRPAAAIAPLEKAVRLVPDRADVWKLLASAYRAAGRPQALKRLRARYQRQFGRSL